jgi:hypothetical protein
MQFTSCSYILSAKSSPVYCFLAVSLFSLMWCSKMMFHTCHRTQLKESQCMPRMCFRCVFFTEISCHCFTFSETAMVLCCTALELPCLILRKDIGVE